MEGPHLERREEFEAILKGYQASAQAKAVLAQVPLVLLTAPTAVGRNTIIQELIKTDKYHFIVTDTTRPPRVNNGIFERDGVEYFFRREDAMLDDIKHGRFAEASIIHSQQVSGVSIREIEVAHKLDKIAITDIDVAGTEKVLQAKPNASAIFVLPPDFDEWLRRLKKRNPDMTTAELERRLTSAAKELSMALECNYYTFVINENLAQAVETVDQVVRFGNIDPAIQERARTLIHTLLTQTEHLLKTGVNSTN